MKHSVRSTFVVGFALFAMFFGAGNVIFPPYLGLGCGSRWVQGFLCYFLADIGLALMALFAVVRCGSFESLVSPLGRISSAVLMTVIVICIGPMLAIPRTAASTFEMSVVPLMPGFSPVLFSVLFFALIAVLAAKESAVVDIVGKILTPLLLLGLLALIIRGISVPIGPVSHGSLVENVAVTGIEAGYQTMDVLGAVVFGIIVLQSVQDKGYTEKRQQRRIVAGAGLIAGIILFAVYLGLCYLGASASILFDTSVDRTHLVTTIVYLLLGKAGTIIFAIVVALACITTAVALVSSAAAYFEELSRGRLSYRWGVIIVCLFSAVVSTVGLNEIISIAAPILDVVYPPTLFLLALSFFNRHLHRVWGYRLGALGAAVVSILNVAAKLGAPFAFLEKLPFYENGFCWLLPAILCALIGFLIPQTAAGKEPETLPGRG